MIGFKRNANLPTRSACNTARVPNSIPFTGTRSFAAWMVSMKLKSSGNCRGVKPYVWMPSLEKKRASETPLIM